MTVLWLVGVWAVNGTVVVALSNKHLSAVFLACQSVNLDKETNDTRNIAHASTQLLQFQDVDIFLPAR